MTDAPDHPTDRGAGPWVAATLATAVAMLLLDLVWLGVVGRSLYDDALGSLRRPTVYWPAALLFYAFYVAAILRFAVAGSRTPSQAMVRGGWLGLVAYATYELTNWAVIADWPAVLVPIDIAWGVALTAVVAGVGRLSLGAVARRQGD